MGRIDKKSLLAVGLAALLLLIAMYSTRQSGEAGPVRSVVGAILTPLQRGVTAATYFVTDKLSYFTEHRALIEENERLNARVLELEQQLRDYDRYKQENENLREFAGVLEQEARYEYAYARVIARDPDSLFYTFTIDKGSADGLQRYDAVTTPEGLAGLVTEVGLTYAKVTAIIDEITPIGAVVSRTRDMGVLESDAQLHTQGLCRVNYLPGEGSAAPGDSVETSGLGGLFPSGLVIGTVVEVQPEAHNISSYAVVRPAVDFANIRYVMVIKSFVAPQAEWAGGEP
ncbi:MAG: rod shape-determining protein MreC [Clostridiales bacterium]|nr:rod shape-determining protein MreC [Clostridiales bacterium]